MTYDQILNKAAALCSQSEKAPKDIYEKALAWGLDEDDAERLVQYLTDEHFLSAERYAHAFVGDKFRFEHWGRIKISYALRAKGIDDSLIDIALEDKIDPDEYLETCRELLASKRRTLSDPLTPNDRAKLFRFAAQRGFETSVISRALDF